MTFVLCQSNLSGCDLGSVRLVLSDGTLAVETSVNPIEETDESEWYRECAWKLCDEIEEVL